MTRGQGAVTAIALAAAAACLYGILAAGQRIYESIGPSKAVATPDGRLYLVSHGKIHIFGDDGKRRETVDLAKLGVTRTPSDLAVHADGRVVVASPDGSDLRRCKLPEGPCERIDPQLTQVPAQFALPLNSVKILIDEERQRYFLSDNAGHHVVETDFTGKRIAQTRDYEVMHPNQLAFDAPGRLRVVDTDHHAIRVFEVSGGEIKLVSGGFRTNASGVVRDGRGWPFDSVRVPGGDTWVLVATALMKDADLIVYGVDGKPARRIDLGEDSDPFDIELWHDRVVVADATNYRVEAVGLDGKRSAAFNDPVFDDELAKAKKEPEFWKGIRIGSQVGIVAVPLLAIVLLRLLGVPLSVSASKGAPPPGSGEKLGRQVRWIGLSATFSEALRKRARTNLLLMIPFIAFLGAGWYFVFGSKVLDDPKIRQMLWLAGAVVVLQLALTPLMNKRAGRRFEGYRLGASEDGLDYELPKGFAPFGGRTGRAPWRDVYYDGKRLLAGKKQLYLELPPRGPAYFDPAELERVILANVPQANRISASTMTMRATGPLLLLLAVAIVGIAFWLVLARSL